MRHTHKEKGHSLGFLYFLKYNCYYLVDHVLVCPLYLRSSKLCICYAKPTSGCGSNAADWLVTPEVPMVIMP
jgi:hypothetical protein